MFKTKGAWGSFEGSELQGVCHLLKDTKNSKWDRRKDEARMALGRGKGSRKVAYRFSGGERGRGCALNIID